MFYSQSFLTRKGPMGTVWCAAHLQHKLRKSHYISTNIPSTVEKIIDPVMPMALRISGHLLLGVVRIFSKQVDYFQEDCNVVLATLNRIYVTATFNLPNDANRPLAVTLPENFNLDTIDNYLKEGYEDFHIKSFKDITLAEDPTGVDCYTPIRCDEHESRSPSFTENVPETNDTPNFPSPHRADTDTDSEDPSNVRVSTPTSIEIIRANVVHSPFNGSPILPDRAPPDGDLVKQFTEERKAINTPSRVEVELPETQFSPSHKHDDKILSAHSKSPEISENSSLQLNVRPTPTPAIAEPKIRKRRRNQLYDNLPVLNNDQVKKALDDTTGLSRLKRNCPSSALDIWRQSKRLKKYDVFYEPSLTGSCAELTEIYNEDFISSKHLATSTTNDDMDISQDEEMGDSQPDLREDDGIEIRRDNSQSSPNMPFSEAGPFPSGRTPEKSASPIHEQTEIPQETTVGPSARSFESEMESPNTLNKEIFNTDYSGLFDIPELANSEDDLGFLEQDIYSSGGSPQTVETNLGSKNQETTTLHHSLSSRTRATAKYLKGQFPRTPISFNTEVPLSGDLNLNMIMEGKSRKKCARMFFETLVLKHNDIIDVVQEGPYGDVILKATLKLSKGDF